MWNSWKVCKHCGGEMAWSSRHCPWCGARQVTSGDIVGIIIFLILIFGSAIPFFFSGNRAKQQKKYPDVKVTITTPTPEAEKPKNIVYSDDNLEIEYLGCTEDNQPWMTERGFEYIDIKGVVLSVTHKAEHTFFIYDVNMYIDDSENLAPTFSETCCYRLYVGKTAELVFYSPYMDTLSPQRIKMDMHAFAIETEYPDFEDYDFSFEFEVTN